MINPRELRIGNWFDWNNLASMGFGRCQILYGEEIDRYNDFKEPIILTSEILEKCGFNKIEGEDNIWEELKLSTFDVIWWIPGMYFISTDGVGGDFDFNHCTDEDTYWTIHHSVKHLHQLQNLYFAITGEELEINLENAGSNIKRIVH